MERHFERFRRHYRRFCALRLELRVFAWIGIGVSIYLVAYFSSTPSRSYTIVAVSRGVEIEFRKGGLSDWRLGNAEICRPLPRRERPNGEGVTASACDSRRYAVVPIAAVEIIWPEGAKISIVRGGDGFVRIAVRRTEAPVPIARDQSVSADDFIVVAEQSFDQSGVLPFYGCVHVGLSLQAGTNSELMSGRYEIRERLFPRSATRTVATGEFLPGDGLSFQRSTSADEQPCLPVGGFLGATGDADLAGMRLVAYAPFEPASFLRMSWRTREPVLRVDRRGLEPAFLVPDWMDRAAGDPWLLGIVAIFTFLATLKTLCIDSLSLLARETTATPVSPAEALSAPPDADGGMDASRT